MGARLNDLVEEFLSSERYNAQTKRAYRTDLSDFEKALPSGITLLKAERGLVKGYIKRCMANSADKERAHPASPLTKARKVSCLKSFYKWCKKENLISENPVQVAVRCPYSPSSITPEKDIESMLAECGGSRNEVRDAAIIISMAELGLKVGGVVDLTLGDVQYVRRAGALIVTIAHARQAREVQLSPPYADPFWVYCSERDEYTSGAPFFRNKSGLSLSSRSIRRIVEKYSNPSLTIRDRTEQAERNAGDTRLAQALGQVSNSGSKGSATCESLRNAFFARLHEEHGFSDEAANIAGLTAKQLAARYKRLGLAV